MFSSKLFDLSHTLTSKGVEPALVNKMLQSKHASRIEELLNIQGTRVSDVANSLIKNKFFETL